MSFFRGLDERSAQTRSRLCVGLDPDPARIAGTDIAGFLREVIAATHDVVCCYKPNLAFFEAFGEEGWSILRRTLDGIPDGVPVIADAKRGDIGSTAEAYARALFERWDFDAATVNAYGGEDTVRPFLDYGGRGVYVWCRSSNPGAADLQDLPVADGSGGTRPLFEVLAERVRTWNTLGNAALVAGATYPAQMARLRALCPELPFLVPGVGAQGAALNEAVQAAAMANGGGFIVNASRGVLYASTGADFAEAARREALALRDAINEASESRVVSGE
jgi:orotidine-5'-phosphate decarboxylase